MKTKTEMEEDIYSVFRNHFYMFDKDEWGVIINHIVFNILEVDEESCMGFEILEELGQLKSECDDLSDKIDIFKNIIDDKNAEIAKLKEEIDNLEDRIEKR